MKKITKKDLIEFINSNSNVVQFGSSDNAVSEEWIEKAEKQLGGNLPESYVWFLKNYVGGEIGSEEIYSIYGMTFETIQGNDIVAQHLANLRNKTTEPTKVAVSVTDFGEFFYFDFSMPSNGECPIYLKLPSGKSVLYAQNFYEFLYKRIDAHVS